MNWSYWGWDAGWGPGYYYWDYHSPFDSSNYIPGFLNFWTYPGNYFEGWVPDEWWIDYWYMFNWPTVYTEVYSATLVQVPDTKTNRYYSIKITRTDGSSFMYGHQPGNGGTLDYWFGENTPGWANIASAECTEETDHPSTWMYWNGEASPWWFWTPGTFELWYDPEFLLDDHSSLVSYMVVTGKVLNGELSEESANLQVGLLEAIDYYLTKYIVTSIQRLKQIGFSAIAYELRNPTTKQIYSGYSAGWGTTTQVFNRRLARHHIDQSQFSDKRINAGIRTATIDAGPIAAALGREQHLIDNHGGVPHPRVANQIRGTASDKWYGRTIDLTSVALFWPRIADYNYNPSLTGLPIPFTAIPLEYFWHTPYPNEQP